MSANEEVLDRVPSRTMSWPALSLAGGVLACTAALCLALVLQFVKSRPLDLRQESRAVTDALAGLLEKQGIPPSRIAIGPEAPMEDTGGRWFERRYDVDMPEGLAVGALVRAIQTEMTSRNAVVLDAAGETEGVTELRVAEYGRDMALVRLRGTSQPAGVLPGPPLPQSLLAAPAVDLPLPNFHLGGLDIDEVMKIALPDEEELPLDSSELNGDARQQAFPEPEPREWETPRIAIIVDDGGYGGPITEHILGLDPHLTLSILPHTPYGTETAERAEELGFQVMLHMPMENSVGRVTFPGQITTDMTPEEIHELTRKALEEIPGAVGVNNHTGSKFTSNPDAMKVFLEGIEDTDLFFVDSRTIRSTQAYRVAKELQIPSAARDLFLDHESDPAYIRARFKQLIGICKRQGSAIGICHFRRNTVPILEEMLPELEKEGITLVHVSELIP